MSWKDILWDPYEQAFSSTVARACSWGSMVISRTCFVWWLEKLFGGATERNRKAEEHLTALVQGGEGV